MVWRQLVDFENHEGFTTAKWRAYVFDIWDTDGKNIETQAGLTNRTRNGLALECQFETH